MILSVRDPSPPSSTQHALPLSPNSPQKARLYHHPERIFTSIHNFPIETKFLRTEKKILPLDLKFLTGRASSLPAENHCRTVAKCESAEGIKKKAAIAHDITKQQSTKMNEHVSDWVTAEYKNVTQQLSKWGSSRDK